MKYRKGIIFFLSLCVVALTGGFLLAKGMNGMDKEMGKMMMQSMENMKKVMMMPPEQRMAYIMKVQKESIEHGKKLFDQPGSNAMSCSSCHPNGTTTRGMAEPMPGTKIPIPTLVGAAATFPKFKVPSNAVISLAQMDNNCRMMFMKSKPYPLGGKEANDLAAYVSSLSNGNQVQVGKQSMMKMK